MTETSQDTSSSSPPGTALVVINERLQELAKVPGIDKEHWTLGMKLEVCGALVMLVGFFIGLPFVMALGIPSANATAFTTFLNCFGLPGAGLLTTGAMTLIAGKRGLKTKADKRHLALQQERKQLLLEQSDELKQQHRQRCERLKTAAEEKLASLTDDDRHQVRIITLSDPDEPSKMLNLGITEVAICDKDGQKIERLTARLYQPVSSGELLKAPEIEGVGPIHSERPADESRFPQLRGLRRQGFPVLASR